jgi:lysophospholipase L1-like esterase
MIALAAVGPWLGLGRDERSIFYLWLGLTRSDLAATGGSIFVLGLYATAVAFSRRPSILIYNTIVSLLLLEFGARAIDGQPIFALRNWVAERNPQFTTKSMHDYDPALGWVPKSNMSVSPNQVSSLTTTQHGIRLNQPDASGLPAGAILAVGDSYTFGTGVGDRHSWPAHLERMLGRPVVNAGVDGFGTDQIVLRAESLLRALKPAALVVSFFSHDFERAGMAVFSGASKPYFTMEGGSLVLHNVPVPPYTGRLSETPLWLVLPSYSYFLRFATDRLGWGDWQQIVMRTSVWAANDPTAVSCALLRRLQTELAASGTKLLLVLQYPPPMREQRPPKVIVVAGCAREIGIDLLDLWEDLLRQRDRSPEQYARLWVSSEDGHMSSQGNRFVAERIAAGLTK